MVSDTRWWCPKQLLFIEMETSQVSADLSVPHRTFSGMHHQA